MEELDGEPHQLVQEKPLSSTHIALAHDCYTHEQPSAFDEP
jgi:hypothetical protein